MFSLKEIFNRNPIQISGAVLALANFAIIMDWIDMTADQVAAGNGALGAILGLFVVTKTTNTAKLEELQQQL